LKITSKLNEYLGSHTPVRKRNVYEEFFSGMGKWNNAGGVKGAVAGNMGKVLLE
jgi:hypothetical protein